MEERPSTKPCMKVEYDETNDEEGNVVFRRKTRVFLFKVVEEIKNKDRGPVVKEGREVVLLDWDLYVDNEKMASNEKLKYVKLEKPFLFKINRNGKISIKFSFHKSHETPLQLGFRFHINECQMDVNHVVFTPLFMIKSEFYKGVQRASKINSQFIALEKRIEKLENLEKLEKLEKLVLHLQKKLKKYKKIKVAATSTTSSSSPKKII